MSIKEENLIQYDGTLKVGQRLTKVGNIFMPVGIGGAFEPGGAGGGGSAKYYKCATVDTTTNTWTGYELILTDGKYTVSSDVTTGLIYTSVTPELDSVYSEDALIEVRSYYDGIPVNGLVFYAPLSEASATAETGQILTAEGTVTYETVDDVPCIHLTNGTGLKMNNSTDIPVGTSPRTLSIWCKSAEDVTQTWSYIFGYAGLESSGANFIFSLSEGNKVGVDGFYAGGTIDVANVSFTEWNHFAVTFSDSVISFYVNGVYAGQIAGDTFNTGFLYIHIGSCEFAWHFNGYIAGCRIYNRALSQDEITTLANEFTPTTA